MLAYISLDMFVMFVWFISIPMILFGIFTYFKDPSRYMLVPLVVGANLVFVLVCSLLALVSITFTIIHGNTLVMRILTICNCVVLLWTVAMNEIYRIRFAKKDLLRTEEQEIDA